MCSGLNTPFCSSASYPSVQHPAGPTHIIVQGSALSALRNHRRNRFRSSSAASFAMKYNRISNLLVHFDWTNSKVISRKCVLIFFQPWSGISQIPEHGYDNTDTTGLWLNRSRCRPTRFRSFLLRDAIPSVTIGYCYQQYMDLISCVVQSRYLPTLHPADNHSHVHNVKDRHSALRIVNTVGRQTKRPTLAKRRYTLENYKH